MARRRKGSVAASVAEDVQHAQRRFFRAEDFAGPRLTVERELSRLVAAGDLLRVRNGLYWCGPRTALGIAPPREDELLDELLAGCTYGPAGYSAANLLGATTQVPGRTEIAVTGRPPRDLPTIAFRQRAGRRQRSELGLRPVEIALLELCGDWDDLVEEPDRAEVQIRRLLHEGAVRDDKLAAALVTEPPVVRCRVHQLVQPAVQAA